MGCGTDYKQGWINVDRGNCDCDVQHDIENYPWPFDDGVVEVVYMQHVLEHLDPNSYGKLVAELHRVLKPGGIFQAISPHATSDNFNTDPTHKWRLTTRTFDYVDPSKALYENGVIYGWGDYKFHVESSVIECGENGPNIAHLLKKS